ncbi:MAG: hypothetical protein P1T08_17335 [Acidimicrobiia bacterium]|nr:hypothetical protein [Acidimicrobiia bacterium]
MTTVRVGRSPIRMWLFALAGVPFVVVGADFLARRRILNWLVTLVYEDRTPDAFEARDTLWAILFLLFGLVLVVVGLKELLRPRPTLIADEATTRWALRGPFRSLVEIPWEMITGWSAVVVDDAGTAVPALVLELTDRVGLPGNPWAARWQGEATLIVLTEDWEQSAQVVEAALHELDSGRSRPDR